MSLLYRTINDKAEWTKITTERVLTGWSHDPEGRKPASEAEADAAGDDIYTDYGWNTEPQRYPVLAHIEACATSGSRLDESNKIGLAQVRVGQVVILHNKDTGDECVARLETGGKSGGAAHDRVMLLTDQSNADSNTPHVWTDSAEAHELEIAL